MIYESTDYRNPNDPARRGHKPMPGDPLDPLDIPGGAGSAKGPLIGLGVILAVIVLMVALAYGADQEEAAPGVDSGATQSIPSDGTSGGIPVEPAPAPQLGE